MLRLACTLCVPLCCKGEGRGRSRRGFQEGEATILVPFCPSCHAARDIDRLVLQLARQFCVASFRSAVNRKASKIVSKRRPLKSDCFGGLALGREPGPEMPI